MLVNLNDVLIPAQKHRYAVGLFNTIDTDMLEAVIDAAEALRSPVIIGTAEILLPYGELDLIAPSVIAAAKRATVPVVVHYDHGLTFERCIQALRLGFTSVMFDGSAGEQETNIRNTAEIVRIAHACGATVEGEIGHVGEASEDAQTVTDQYTTLQEALAFTEATGVDALAVAIGTAHGTYKQKPKLDLERLRTIRAGLDTPLVLHGGSGLSDDDFRNAIRNGIAKINIFTDLCKAAGVGMAQSIREGMNPVDSGFYLNMRNKRVEWMKDTVKEKIMLFGSSGKA